MKNCNTGTALQSIQTYKTRIEELEAALWDMTMLTWKGSNCIFGRDYTPEEKKTRVRYEKEIQEAKEEIEKLKNLGTEMNTEDCMTQEEFDYVPSRFMENPF